MILSIIIPIYKVEKYLEKCILSCVNQNIPSGDYEIIAVNDGSPDKSLQIVERIASHYANIRVITRQNGGLSAARNTGIDNAKGEYLFFVDSDDWIENNCLRKITDVLKEQKPDVLCICSANVLGNQIARRMSYEGLKSESGPESMLHYVTPCATFHIVRKAHLDQNNIRFYEGIFHEDTEYTPRMRYLAKKVSYLNDIIYFVFQNSNSITRTVNIKKIYDVITVVVPNLHYFSIEHVNLKYRSVYMNIISSSINTVLTSNYPLSWKEQREINKLLSDRSYLFDDYCKSTKFRYKMEGMLFKLFPNNPVDIFYLMKFKFKFKYLIMGRAG